MIQPTQFKGLLYSCFLAILGCATELPELKQPNDSNPIIPVCDEPGKANEFDGVLVPSFLVSGIVGKLGNANSFDGVGDFDFPSCWLVTSGLPTTLLRV